MPSGRGGLEGQHSSLRAGRHKGSVSSPPSSDTSEDPASRVLAGESEGRRIGPQLPVCETGGALAWEGGWEAWGNQMEVQTVVHLSPSMETIPRCPRSDPPSPPVSGRNILNSDPTPVSHVQVSAEGPTLGISLVAAEPEVSRIS